MVSAPKLSILIPVFNGANYLRETIDSILNKIDLNETEVIVINDGSTDESEEICLSYIDKIMYISQSNQGEFAATNNGLNIAKGKYIMVVSHDDPMLSSSLIPDSIKELDLNENIVCVYPDWQIIDAYGNVLQTKIVEEYSEEELIGKFNCLPGPGAVFRRNSALEIGGRRKWKFVSDYDFWLRLSRIGEFKRISGVAAQWRSHQNSTTVSMKSFEMANERIAVVKNFIETQIIDERISRRGMSSAYYFAARLGVFSNKIPAKRWMLRSLFIRRGWPEVANPFVVIFVFTMPISKLILRLVKPFSRRLKTLF